MKQRRVCRDRDRGFLDRGRDELDVSPVVLSRPRPRELEHLGTLLDSDDRTLGADKILERRQAETGAAADIQNAISLPQTERLDRAMPHGLKQQELEIIDTRARPILAQRSRAVRREPPRQSLKWLRAVVAILCSIRYLAFNKVSSGNLAVSGSLRSRRFDGHAK